MFVPDLCRSAFCPMICNCLAKMLVVVGYVFLLFCDLVCFWSLD